ncbi:hypothetical protein Glove_681g12 [Diversispora epigaea]|uniref:Uncharacterized protein n=1 Tax=Diversispora epigaea TaxID=1348612 RepID=A0A397G8T5_9GLOM|nr:hypothetical protein Glove_681g12 [Diversispora epigaea]
MRNARGIQKRFFPTLVQDRGSFNSDFTPMGREAYLRIKLYEVWTCYVDTTIEEKIPRPSIFFIFRTSHLKMNIISNTFILLLQQKFRISQENLEQ